MISQAQMTLCDQTYTTGNYYVYEIAIPTTGNGLPTMAPLYAITYTSQDTLEDSCFGGPCAHTVYNEYAEDTITTCITYTLTDSLGYVNTLMCCLNNVWNGQEWVDEATDNLYTWTCPQNGIGCYEVMDGSGDYATEEECSASCDSIIYCNGSVEITEEDGQLTANVYGVTLPVSYEWSNLENTQTITPSADGVYACYIVDADGCDYFDTFPYYSFDFCDSTWYDADFTEADGLWEVTLSGYISENLNDLTDTVLHSFTVTPSNDFMSQYGDAGSYPHSWSPEFALSLTTDDTLTICWSATVYADGLNAFPQGYSEMCNMSNEQMICENWLWNGEEWVVESENVVNPTDALLNICDSLDVYTSNSSENSVTLSTNLYFLESNLEISFSWESWGDYLDVEIVEGQNAFFNLPNNLESFYFLLQVVIGNEQSESSEVLCIYPFLIQWDSSTNTWQANSLTMSQMPTSIDAYSQSSERKLIKIVDALGRENQENKNMILFYIYDDGKIEKKFIIE